MNRNMLIAIGIAAAAAFGFWAYKNKQNSTATQQPQDQTPATAAQQYYTAPPSVGIQPNNPSQVFLNQTQVMPLPYNT